MWYVVLDVIFLVCLSRRFFWSYCRSLWRVNSFFNCHHMPFMTFDEKGKKLPSIKSLCETKFSFISIFILKAKFFWIWIQFTVIKPKRKKFEMVNIRMKKKRNKSFLGNFYYKKYLIDHLSMFLVSGEET